eukprot:3054642-Pleurochrysis_carterae.AAC.1
MTRSVCACRGSHLTPHRRGLPLSACLPGRASTLSQAYHSSMKLHTSPSLARAFHRDAGGARLYHST